MPRPGPEYAIRSIYRLILSCFVRSCQEKSCSRCFTFAEFLFPEIHATKCLRGLTGNCVKVRSPREEHPFQFSLHPCPGSPTSPSLACWGGCLPGGFWV